MRLIDFLNCTSALAVPLLQLSHFLPFQRSTFICQRVIVLDYSCNNVHVSIYSTHSLISEDYEQVIYLSLHSYILLSSLSALFGIFNSTLRANVQHLSVLSLYTLTSRHVMESSFQWPEMWDYIKGRQAIECSYTK